MLWVRHKPETGLTGLKLAEFSGWHSISRALGNIANMCEGICEDHRWTIHDVCYIVGLAYGVCRPVRPALYEADCCKIDAKAADWLPEATSAGSQHGT